jgi:hypothetical protein
MGIITFLRITDNIVDQAWKMFNNCTDKCFEDERKRKSEA